MDARKIRRLVYGALLAAIIATLTYAVKFPIPGTSGYVHPGDSGIALAGILFGPYAAIPAAIGSGLADLLGGYAQYALFTVIIKGLMGLIAGYGCLHGKLTLKSVSSLLIAGVVLIGGYFLADMLLYGVAAALISLPWNLLQFAVFLISGIVFLATRLSKLTEKL